MPALSVPQERTPFASVSMVSQLLRFERVVAPSTLSVPEAVMLLEVSREPVIDTIEPSSMIWPVVSVSLSENLAT